MIQTIRLPQEVLENVSGACPLENFNVNSA
jgi:hypothetical protein